MNLDYATHFLAAAIATLRKQKALAEPARAPLDGAAFAATLGAESRSVAVVMKHLASTMRARCSDFAHDGAMFRRERAAPYELGPLDADRAGVRADWEDGWRHLFDALAALAPADLGRTVVVRGEPMTVLQAINRQLAHYSNHVGQIVAL